MANPSTPNYEPTRTILKRIVVAVNNFVVLIITIIYLYHAIRHSKTIASSPNTLQTPFSSFKLNLETLGYSAAIGRIVWVVLTNLFVVALSEQFLFVSVLVNLAFEIPMAIVAESAFGSNVIFSGLLSSPHVFCSKYNMTIQQWAFYTAYAAVIGQTPDTACKEFVAEGGLLRASLLYAWFATWICWFLIAFFAAVSLPERHTWDFLVCFTGFPFEFEWPEVNVPKLRMPKMSLPKLKRIRSSRSRKCESDTSTLVDEEHGVFNNSAKAGKDGWVDTSKVNGIVSDGKVDSKAG